MYKDTAKKDISKLKKRRNKKKKPPVAEYGTNGTKVLEDED